MRNDWHPQRLTAMAVIALFAGLGGRCHAGASPTPPGLAWPAYMAQFQQRHFVAHPEFAVYEGRHEFDGRLPDWSAKGIANEIARLTRERRRASAYRDAVLSPRQRFERDYLLARIDADLFWMRDLRAPFGNPAYYQWALDPSVYLTRPYAPLEVRMKAFIAYARAIPKAVEQIGANLQAPMPRTFVSLGIDTFDGYSTFFRKVVPTIFAGVHDAGLQRRLAAAVEPAAAAMGALADRLRAEKEQANDAFAMGPEKFAAMLRMTERVDTPLAELEAIGRADLKRNLDALVQACAAYAPGLDPRACGDRVNADKPTGGAVEGARAQLSVLRQFVIDKDLVSVPGNDVALVAEAPEYQRWNFAYIDIAGPFEKGMPAVYNIAPPDPKWPEDEQLAYTPGQTVLLFTSAHEVWPGHFVQFLHANRSPFLFGRIFVGYAYAEGWAHYSEELMWEAGLGDGAPVVHIGQLLEALLRNVRFVCAVGMHTAGMSVGECETLFREQAFTDPAGARQQAARGTFDPAYLNYTLGKLMIRQLREDWTASRGGRQSWKAFHDTFLSYGGPPIPLVREQMLGRRGDLFGR